MEEKRSPTETELFAKYQAIAQDLAADLLKIGRAEYRKHGRGLILVENADRVTNGDPPFGYWEAEGFIAANPNNLGEMWAATLRTYDPKCAVLVIFRRDEDTRVHVCLIDAAKNRAH